MSAIKPSKCFFPHSSWVHAFILTCDGRLAVWFKRGSRRYHGQRLGGVPGVCCLYPQSNQRLYNLAVVWGSPGKFVWRFLYRKMGYRLVQPPVTPCAGCGTAVVVASSENPSNYGDTVTFTATVTDNDGTATPQGTVAFYDGSTLLGSGSALSGSGNSATSTYATSALTGGNHTIKAVFTPSAGFQGSQGTLSQDVDSSTTTTVTSSLNPSTFGQAVTFTATVSDTSDTRVPTGSVEFFDGSTDLGAGSALSGSGSSATSTFSTSSLSVATHTIKAVYTATGDFQGSQRTVSQVVNSSGISTSCCANTLPTTLHVTFHGSVTGTFALTWTSGTTWKATGANLCGTGSSTLTLTCTAGTWTLTIVGSSGGCSATCTVSGSPTCSPFVVSFACASTSGCCSGAFTAQVTT